MIVDTSALAAILFQEPEQAALIDTIADAPSAGLSAASLVELSVVVDRRSGPVLQRQADRLIRDLGVHVEPFTHTQAEIARAAYRDFGRGSGHPAKLNLGDCFAYALAIDKDEPLLWVGNHFGHTDVRPAR